MSTAKKAVVVKKNAKQTAVAKKKPSAAKQAAAAKKKPSAAKQAAAAKKKPSAAKQPAVKRSASAANPRKTSAAKQPAAAKKRASARQRSSAQEAAPSLADHIAREWDRIEASPFSGRLRPGRAEVELDLDIASDSEVSLPEEYWAFVARHDGEAPGDARGLVAGFRLLAHDEGRYVDVPDFYNEPHPHADVKAAVERSRALAAGRFAAILDRKRPKPDPRVITSSLEWTLAVGAAGARIVLVLPLVDGQSAQVVHCDVDGRETLVARSLLAWMTALPDAASGSRSSAALARAR